MEKPVLRRSTLQAWLTCSAYEPDDSEAAAFGRLLHRMIAGYWARGALLDVDAMLHEVDGVSPDRWGEARDLFARFIATHDPTPPDMYEQQLRVETEHTIIVGTPDAVWRIGPDAALVVDYKGSWGVGDAEWQVRCYAAMLAVGDDDLVTLHGRADPIRAGEDSIQEWTWDADELRLWWRGLVAAIPALLAARENPTPSGGRACLYCRSRWSCGASIAPARNAPHDQEEAREIVGELIRLEAAVDERRKVLRHWFSEREPMVVNGVEVGYLSPREPSFKATANPLTIASYLNERGMSGDAVLGLNSRQIGKALAGELVEAGLGTMQLSAPDFRTRKAS